MASFLRTRHFPARQDRAIGVRASGHLVSWSGLVPSRKLGNSPTFKLLIGLVTLQKQQKAGKSKQMSRWWNSKERVTQLMLLWGHSEDVWGWHFAHSGGIAGKGCRSLSYPSHPHRILIPDFRHNGGHIETYDYGCSVPESSRVLNSTAMVWTKIRYAAATGAGGPVIFKWSSNQQHKRVDNPH